MSDSERPYRLPRPRFGPPGPLDPVKRELGLILLVALLLLAVVHRLVSDGLGQVLVLAGFGSAAALWLVWRTRALLARHQREAGDGREPQ